MKLIVIFMVVKYERGVNSLKLILVQVLNNFKRIFKNYLNILERIQLAGVFLLICASFKMNNNDFFKKHDKINYFKPPPEIGGYIADGC